MDYITYIVRPITKQENASKSLNPTDVTAGNSITHEPGQAGSWPAVLFSALPSRENCQDIINECDLFLACI